MNRKVLRKKFGALKESTVRHATVPRIVLILVVTAGIMASTRWTSPETSLGASPFTEDFASAATTLNYDATKTGGATASVDIHLRAHLTATDAWTRVSGFTDGETIYDIAFVSSSITTGWTVTDSGTMRKTIDGGVLWSIQTSGVSQPLRALSVIDANTVMAVGGSSDDTAGIVLKTTNGGTTWTQQTISGAPTLYDVYFTSSSNGWAVGANGKIYRTTDGGSNWSTLTSGTTNKLTGVSVDPSGTKGMIVGSSGTILRSTDSGATWSSRSTTNATETTFLPYVDFQGLSFRDGNTGWLFGSGGTIFKTTDHGDTALTIQSVGTISNALLETAVAAYLLTNNPGAFRSTVQPVYNGWFADANTGITVGGAGLILKTTNGGATWAHQVSAVNQPLYSATMLSTTNAFVVGGAAIMFNTTNGGTTWNEMTQGSAETLAVDFAPSSTTGWTVGNSGLVLKTTNSGATWIGTTSPNYSRDFRSVVAADTNIVWVVGSSGAIYKSTNGGTTWTQQTSNVSVQLNAVGYSAPTALAVGNGGTILTHNSTVDGTTWTARTSGTTATLHGIAIPLYTTMWAVGDNGTILQSTNAGVTWTAQNSGVTTTLYAAYAADGNTVYVVGSEGRILKTTNGGTSWSQQTSGTTNNLVAIDSDGTRVWAIGGNGTIVSTTNSGTTWSTLTSGVTTDLYDVNSSTGDTAIVVGDQENILQTTNGTAWTTVHADVVRLINDVESADTTTFYAAGFNGLIVKSTDAGAHWSILTSGTSSNLSGVAVASTTTVWVAGASGAILKTADGTTWSAQVSGTTQNLNDIEDASSSVLWAMGANGTIVKTTDGGATWTTQSSGVTTELQSADAVDANTAYVVGNNGTLLKTTNGGTTWTALTSGTTQHLYGVSFVTSTTGWVSGASGTILKTTDGGATWSSLPSGTTRSIQDIHFIDSQTGSAVLNASDSTVLHSINGGASWTTTTGVTGGKAIWVASFDTVAVVGAGHTTNRYTPTYASSGRVVSPSIHSDATTVVDKATFTATETLNGQTITYYLLNADSSSSACGAGSWKQITPGSQYTFTASGPKLYWCATLSSTSSTTTPVISQVHITYTTATPGRAGGGDTGGGDTGGGTGSGTGGGTDGGQQLTGCTSNAQCANGYYCNLDTHQCVRLDTDNGEQVSYPKSPGPLSPISSTNRIEWRFIDRANNEAGFRLSKKTAGGLEKIDEVLFPNQSSIVEGTRSPLIPNTLYEGRVIQAFNNAGVSPEVNLDPVRTFAETPPDPEAGGGTTRGEGVVIVSRGNNPEDTEFLVHEKTTNRFLQLDGMSSDIQSWQPFSALRSIEEKVPEASRGRKKALALKGIATNTLVMVELKARTTDTDVSQRKETSYSSTLAFTTPIEQPVIVVADPVVSTATALSLAARSATLQGLFSHLNEGQTGFWFENTTTAAVSGWLKEPRWTQEDLAPDTEYTLRARARNSSGDTTAWSPLTAIRTRSLVPEPPVITEPVDGQELPRTEVTIQGRAHRLFRVELTIDKDTTTLTPNASNEWQHTVIAQEGSHTVVARSRNPDTQHISDTATIRFSVKIPPPPCTRDRWQCAQWGDCSSGGQQTRLCRIIDDCSLVQTPKPEEVRSCTPPPPPPPPVLEEPASSPPAEPVTSTQQPTPPSPERRIEQEPAAELPPQQPPSTGVGSTAPAPPVGLGPNDPLPPPLNVFRIGEIRLNGQNVAVGDITTVTLINETTVEITGRARPLTPLTVALSSREAQTVVATDGTWSVRLDLKDQILFRRQALAETTPPNLDILSVKDVEVNKTPVVPGTISSLRVIGNNKLEVRGQGVPGSRIRVIVESTPRTVDVTVGPNGQWETHVDLTGLEEGEHSVKLQTEIGSLASPVVEVARFDFFASLATAVATTVKETVTNAVATTAEAVTQEVKQGFPTVKKGAQVAAETTVKAVEVTHETIVEVEPETKATLAVALPAVAVVNPPLVAAAPQFPFFVYHFVNWLLMMLGIRKKRVPWGVVYDAITKQPIPLAIVRLVDSKTNKLIETQVTDRTGRFGFLVAPSSYTLEVTKTQYVTGPSRIVSGSDDGEYQPCYHGEIITIANDQQTVTMAIPLDPVNPVAPAHGTQGTMRLRALGRLLRKANLPLMMVGLTISIIVVANVPSITNVLLTLGYGLMTGFQRLLAPPELRAWGRAFDLSTMAVIPLALIDIIDAKYNKVMKTRLSDYEGRFAFLPPKGTYRIQARKQGYVFPPKILPKSSKTYRHPYGGETITIATDKGIINADIPLEPLSPPAPAPSPTPSPSLIATSSLHPSPLTPAAPLLPEHGTPEAMMSKQ